MAEEEGPPVVEGEKVGTITGMVGMPEEQAGVVEETIGEKPQLQQQLPALFATMKPGTKGCLTGSLAPV